MDIERVNDYTLKFYISYLDIENRGFDREEIWYNRERGEELFWEIMDEAHNQESFPLEGPLWIQVQAMEKGLEIIVTRAQLSQDGSKLELPISEDKHLDIPVNEGLESLISEHFQTDKAEKNGTKEAGDDGSDEELGDDGDLTFLIRFDDLEDVINLSHEFIDHPSVDTALYVYENDYYLDVIFYEDMSEFEQDNRLSCILEYGYETERTIHFIQEYGTEVISENALGDIKKHFPKHS
ncbi:adapter protein MecA 1/2 [Scopulibacillus darangshiensis]|uniref:Adapter protein MecA n=1 Tax=Scopulibacillus darangshiensis TaxID=442528 RepID=A0A4R2P6X2_9BACL|nr:adaptor protein MecA [Scopulibacillus darangshiensis]TCP29741.1 adapter protein MecA 1/2 [Scopulibacillus darangshiensis]